MLVPETFVLVSVYWLGTFIPGQSGFLERWLSVWDHCHTRYKWPETVDGTGTWVDHPLQSVDTPQASSQEDVEPCLLEPSIGCICLQY